MLPPSPPPTGAVAAVVAASSAQAQGQAHPIVVVVAIALYVVAWVAYFQMLRLSASEFRWGTTWERVIVVVVEILMALALLIPIGILVAHALSKGGN